MVYYGQVIPSSSPPTFHWEVHLLTGFSRYYSKTDLCPAYAIAVALHPNMKLAYFHEEWAAKPDWIAGAVESIDHRWHESYRGYSTAHADERVVEEQEAGVEEGYPLSRWDRKRLALNQDNENVDMMGRFQQDPPLKERVTDVIQYWFGKSMDSHWRDLAKMALDYLTIPAMSAEPERVFSAAKLSLSDRRCRMGDDAVEALECLKSWQRDGLIAASRQDVKAMEDMPHALCQEDPE